jgi:MFS family permease
VSAIGQLWRHSTGEMPRLFWLLWVGVFLNRLGYVVQPFFALYLSGRGLSSTVAGTVLSCFGAGALVSQPIGGYLADRVGRRRTLVLGMLSSAATAAAIPFAPGLAGVAVVAGLYGVAVDLYRPAISALVVDSVPGQHRTRAFGLIYWAVNLGSAVAGVLGGVLAAHAFWTLFALNAITSAAFAVTAARFLPADRPIRPPSDARVFRPAIRDGLLVAITASFLVFAIIAVQAYVTLPIVMRSDGFGPAAYGLVFAVNPTTVIVVQPLTLRWLSGLSPQLVYAASMLLTGVGFGLTAFADTLPAYAGTVLIWSLGEIAVAAVGPALVAEIAPAHLQGSYSGVFGTAYGAASLVGPIAGASMLQYHGSSALWAGCLLCGAASALFVWALGPAIERRRAGQCGAERQR